jgi:alkylhydroperoxidase family enzyme
MSRIPVIERDEAPEQLQHIYDSIIEEHGYISNTKKTLAHAPEVLQAYMQFYAVDAAVDKFIDERLRNLLLLKVSLANRCELCSAHLLHTIDKMGIGQEIMEAIKGEVQGSDFFSEKEKVLLKFAEAAVTDPGGVSDELFADLQRFYSDAEIVAIVGLIGLMTATNNFNSILRVDLDDHLLPYRDGETES